MRTQGGYMRGHVKASIVAGLNIDTKGNTITLDCDPMTGQFWLRINDQIEYMYIAAKATVQVTRTAVINFINNSINTYVTDKAFKDFLLSIIEE